MKGEGPRVVAGEEQMRRVAREERWMVTPVERVAGYPEAVSDEGCDPHLHDRHREPVLYQISRIRGKATFVGDVFGFRTQPIASIRLGDSVVPRERRPRKPGEIASPQAALDTLRTPDVSRLPFGPQRE